MPAFTDSPFRFAAGTEIPVPLPHPEQLLAIEQQLFFARARRFDVDRRVDPSVGELAVESELHVAGALELLEDHFVHLRPGLHEGRAQDGEAAAFLDVASGPDEPLGRVEGSRDAAAAKGAT